MSVVYLGVVYGGCGVCWLWCWMGVLCDFFWFKVSFGLLVVFHTMGVVYDGCGVWMVWCMAGLFYSR